MEKIIITKYKAKDGKVFDNEEEAREYEIDKERKEKRLERKVYLPNDGFLKKENIEKYFRFLYNSGCDYCPFFDDCKIYSENLGDNFIHGICSIVL